MPSRFLIGLCLVLGLSAVCWAEAEIIYPRSRLSQPKPVNTEQAGLGPRFDTSVDPSPPRRGYKVGQRVVFTAWIDNDDPYDGMRDIGMMMPRIPETMRLDLSSDQPAYGNIFYDSRFPALSDTPATCRLYYISRPESDTRPLEPNTNPDSVQSVIWVITRGAGEQVVGPHNANENIYAANSPDTYFGAGVDDDELYVRYSATVVLRQKKKK